MVPVKHIEINSLNSVAPRDFVQIRSFYILTHPYTVYLRPFISLQ